MFAVGVIVVSDASGEGLRDGVVEVESFCVWVRVVESVSPDASVFVDCNGAIGAV